MVSQNGWMDSGAVASRRAAQLYGLDILDEGIQDMKDNVTRFIVLSRSALAYCASLVCLFALVRSSCWATCPLPCWQPLFVFSHWFGHLVGRLARAFVRARRARCALFCTGMVISVLLANMDSAESSRIEFSKF